MLPQPATLIATSIERIAQTNQARARDGYLISSTVNALEQSRLGLDQTEHAVKEHERAWPRPTGDAPASNAGDLDSGRNTVAPGHAQ